MVSLALPGEIGPSTQSPPCAERARQIDRPGRRARCGPISRRRQSEVKNGRIAMVAAMGYITPEVAGQLPGYCSFSVSFQ